MNSTSVARSVKWCVLAEGFAVVADHVLGEGVGELVPVLGVERAQIPVLDPLNVFDVTHLAIATQAVPMPEASLPARPVDGVVKSPQSRLGGRLVRVRYEAKMTLAERCSPPPTRSV